ncbi:MAG: DUF4124 domain-containing protein [Geobacteraceae bacterium]
MKVTVVLSMLFIGFSVIAHADIYQWVDSKGVVNFTDDINTIPKKYQKKVKIISTGDVSDGGAVTGPSQPSVQETPKAQSAEQVQQQKTFGGHDEKWWRSQFASLRGELAQLQANLPVKREEAEQLRRRLVIYTYARNRVAYQDKLAEVQRDEARIGTLTGQLSDLDTQASAAGVPFEWRR